MNKIKKQMMLLGLDAQSLGKKLGVSHQAVYGWVNGKTKPKSQYIIPLAKALKMTGEEVIGILYGKKK